MSIDPRIMDAYLDLSGEQARRGILRCGAWEAALLSGESVEALMIRELREAGRLPEEVGDA